MKVLIACEESQEVTEQFILRGHDAMSCDLFYDGAKGLPHYKGNVLDILYDGWDLMIGHPPCTYLSFVGNAHFNIEKYGEKAKQRHILRQEAFDFFMLLWNAPINKICLENPRGYPMTRIKSYQTIHPYYFGDDYKKVTLLWLKNLPPLEFELNLFSEKHTIINEPKPIWVSKDGTPRHWCEALVSTYSNKQELAKARSKTFPGIAKAMAEQWG